MVYCSIRLKKLPYLLNRTMWNNALQCSVPLVLLYYRNNAVLYVASKPISCVQDHDNGNEEMISIYSASSSKDVLLLSNIIIATKIVHHGYISIIAEKMKYILKSHFQFSSS